MKKFYAIIKNILFAREPGTDYFDGAEGAIRFLLFLILLASILLLIWVF